MSAVGIVSIAVGVFALCVRIPLVVAPAATLRRFRGTIRTNGRIRVLGAFVLPVGATMVWAGNSEDSGLAGVLLLLGLGIVAMATLALVMFPGAYRALADELLPSDPSGSLTGWRLVGLAGGFLEYYLDGDPWGAKAEYERHSPINFVDRARTPTLIMQGESDLRVPLPQAQELYRALVNHGVEVEYVILPGQGHVTADARLQRDSLERNLAWFERWLGGATARTSAPPPAPLP